MKLTNFRLLFERIGYLRLLDVSVANHNATWQSRVCMQSAAEEATWILCCHKRAKGFPL